MARTRYLSITSYRRDGSPVSTPVWCALIDGYLWCRSAARSGKVRRIAVHPRVLLAPCARDGTPTASPVPATATVVPRVERPDVYRLVVRRGGWWAPLYDLWWTRVQRTSTVLIRFTVTPSP